MSSSKKIGKEGFLMTYPEVQLPQIPDRTLHVTEYGAIGNGMFDNTAAFNETIAACAHRGGGKVVIPAGIWPTGPIQLKSKIELHLERGAFVQFSKQYSDYPLITSSFEGNVTVRCQSPIDGEDLNDIAITGEGVFDGSGEAWRPVKKSKMTVAQWNKLVTTGGVVDEEKEIWWPNIEAMNGSSVVEPLIEQRCLDPDAYASARSYLRPNLLSLRKCQRILLHGVTFQNSPAWNLHPWASQHITIRHVNVRNPWYSQNGDGLDIDSCKHVHVEHCSFDVGDDAICLKSGKDKMGRELGLPCEYVQIQNCYVYHGHGGFVIGSEMSGDVRHVQVSDCLFMGTDIGLRFKSARGRGGVVEHISISNIQMVNIVHEAISFHLFYEGKSGSGTASHDYVTISDETPIFRDIEFNNIVVNGAQKALLVNGLAEMPVKRLTVNQLTYSGAEGIECTYLEDSSLNQLTLNVKHDGSPIMLNACEHVIYSWFGD